ncbi:UNVERIFIED_CONTAM: hypothetical protein K2H54_065911, partial [Gekko kuhli]
TFGQAEPWDIFTPTSWKHPMVPYEILIDSQSMPNHPVLGGESFGLQITDKDENTQDTANCNPRFAQVISEVMKEEINRQFSTQAPSRRLKHERSKFLNRLASHGKPSTYHTINYYEIDSFPGDCEKPDLSILGTDIFSTHYQGAAEP